MTSLAELYMLQNCDIKEGFCSALDVETVFVDYFSVLSVGCHVLFV